MPDARHDSSLRPCYAWLGSLLFLFSGALGLCYELCWVRALSLEMGSSSLAVSTVVAVFMGGLALGAWLGGRWADRISSPFANYGVLEILLGCYALATPLLFDQLLPLFATMAASRADQFLFISVLRSLWTGLLLLPPTLIMGATFPLLARSGATWVGDPSRWAGLLYGVNTLGAFAGTMVTGFVLLPHAGLTRTLFIAGTGSVIVGVTALIAGRREGQSAMPEPCDTSSRRPGESHLLGLVVALTGFAALACEVIWTRVLVLVFGSSAYSFTVVLGTFLAGLGMGAVAAASLLRSRPGRATMLVYGLALTSAVVVTLASACFSVLPSLFITLFWKWNVKEHADLIFRLEFVLASLVLLVPSAVMGGLLPAALRASHLDYTRVGRDVGTLYAWNTIGSIAGSLAAGFVLIPALGIRGGLQVAAVTQCVAAWLAISRCRTSRIPRAALAGLAVVVASGVLFGAPSWDRHLMTSGVFRDVRAYKPLGAEHLKSSLKKRSDLLFYRDGLTATVTVSRDHSSPNASLFLATNGKIDASSHEDRATQSLLAHVPMLFHPDPRTVCVIGMGSGCTAGTAALYNGTRVSVVEIEQAVVEGARLFDGVNYDIHQRDNVEIHVADGRLFLRLHPKAFDVIISEPSNPWLAGTSDLFTEDFYRLAAASMKEGGIMCQWAPVYGLSPESYRMMIRTFLSVFPHSYLVVAKPLTDTLLLGSQTPFTPDLARANARFAWPGVMRDLADPETRIYNIYDLAARVRAGPTELKDLAGSGPLHTDDLPRLAYRSPRELYLDTRALNETLIRSHGAGLCPYLPEVPDFGRGPVTNFFEKLAGAYREVSPGGREADACAAKAGEDVDP